MLFPLCVSLLSIADENNICKSPPSDEYINSLFGELVLTEYDPQALPKASWLKGSQEGQETLIVSPT